MKATIDESDATIGEFKSLLSFMEDHPMTGAEWNFARYFARQAVKRELQGQGIKLPQVGGL